MKLEQKKPQGPPPHCRTSSKKVTPTLTRPHFLMVPHLWDCGDQLHSNDHRYPFQGLCVSFWKLCFTLNIISVTERRNGWSLNVGFPWKTKSKDCLWHHQLRPCIRASLIVKHTLRNMNNSQFFQSEFAF